MATAVISGLLWSCSNICSSASVGAISTLLQSFNLIRRAAKDSSVSSSSFWASNPNEKHQTYNNPFDAYGNYTNSGVAIVNNKKAVLYLNSPEKYKVPSGITLNKHIHYRVAVPNNPFLTKVKTIFI